MSFGERAVEALRQAGGRLTPQRQLLIDLLASAEEPLDAEALYALARAQDTSVSLATVYRTLSALEAAGLVRPRYLSPRHDRKYIEPVAEDVYHFTCRNCHRVISFSTALVDALRRELEARLRVETLNACLCVDGLCPACREQQVRERGATSMPESSTLDQLRSGQTARVRKVTGQGAVRRRLLDMGLTSGVEITMLRAAPLGDPIEYRLRGYHLSLRKSEAQTIQVEL